MEKVKSSAGRNPPAPAAPATKSPAPVPLHPPPLFRKIDWLTFGVTALLVFIGYYLTLAPDLTLEDSGELAVGSYYAGVPHPPGYPVWTLYTWLWTVIVPFSNIAWRVALGGAFAGAVACGLLGLLVSRGSSMMMEGIAELKNIDRRWENAICVVSGFVAGALLGFNGYMWSQSVIVEVYSFSVLSLMTVLCCLLRWIYAPHQRRYLYWAFFLFGICTTNHQSLVVAFMGIEVAILATDKRLGRDMFLTNGIFYLIGLIAKLNGMISSFENNQALFMIYNLVGIGSLYVFFWTSVKVPHRMRAITLLVHLFITGMIVAMWLRSKGQPAPDPQAMMRQDALFTQGMIFVGPVGIGVLYLFHLLTGGAERVMTYWKPVVASFGLFVFAAAASNLYMPLASMTNPPMNWGYPRTVEGFFHALTRGQYERTNPTDLFNDPLRFVTQLWMLGEGVVEEFNLVYALIALVPFVFFLHRMQKRERAWLIGIGAIYLCLGVLLLILLNPPPDRAARDLIRVFFTASHVMIAMSVGYGLTLIAASIATQYERFRTWCWVGGAVGAALALTALTNATRELFGERADVSGVSAFFQGVLRAFERDQYGLPIYAGLILLALTLIFVAISVLSRSRPQLGVTLALFAIMPVHSILSHWADNEQRGHMFGYWFGHDMFSPPFDIYPEMTRNAILFGGTDPGRFCPTYMIFCESFIPPRCKKNTNPDFDRRDVYIITQNALADGTYLNYIRAHYNRSTQIDPPFFQELLRTRKERERNYSTNFVARIAGVLLDRPFMALGARIEDRRRRDGVYPPDEIYTPTPDDSQRCFQEYLMDAQRRLQVNQLKPGEDVRIIDNRVQVSGQVAVMSINGLLTKVIFDKNPTNEFFVEESFPLDWMYPHLTPHGIIMKINRQPLAELSEEVVRKDHEFWRKYSERLIGDWITYDTTVQEIADFVERVYLRRNFAGFTGDRKFVRDDQAQKAFSKLRSSIGGVYAWRISDPNNRNPLAQQRMMKEADFAFRQAFAFCPYSPEAVFRYVNLLLNMGRVDDALIVAETCRKLDPFNGQVVDLVNRLQTYKKQAGAAAEIQGQIQRMEDEVRANPTNFQRAFDLAAHYVQLQQTGRAVEVLERVQNHPQVEANAVLAIAQAYASMNNFVKLESALEKLTQLAPEEPEAWYDLAALRAAVGKPQEALPALRRSLELSSRRLQTNPQARNLHTEAANDNRFAALRTLPEYRELMAPK